MESEIQRKSESNQQDVWQARLQEALRLCREEAAGERHSGVDEIARLAAEGHDLALTHLLRLVLELRLVERPVRSVLLDPADVDDAVQGALIAVAERISTFEGRSRFSTWVDRVAKNEALMVVRRKNRLSGSSGAEIPESDRSARRLSSLVADRQTLEAAISQLSNEHQEVLRLREEVGLSYEEIAVHLGLPINTVKTRIFRARRILADLLVTFNGARSSTD